MFVTENTLDLLGETVFGKLVERNGECRMREIVGFWIIFVAIDFLVAFLLGLDFSFVDKLKAAFGPIVLVTLIMIGSYLIFGGV